jgi:hypothetical protein
MPRGVFGTAGGVYGQSEQLQIVHTDPLQSSVIIVLTGTADVINPYQPQGNNYIVNTGSADAMTLVAPVATVDDGLTIAIFSNTAFAHTLTSTGNIQTGGTATGVLTFAAHAGAGILLRAYQGKWQIVGNNLVTLTS